MNGESRGRAIVGGTEARSKVAAAIALVVMLEAGAGPVRGRYCVIWGQVRCHANGVWS